MKFLGQLDLFHLVLAADSPPLDTHGLAEVMDVLSWHPYAGLNLQDGAAALTLIGKGDPKIGEQIRRLAEDAIALGNGDEISAARAALVGRTLDALLAGTPPDQLEELSAGLRGGLAGPLVANARSWEPQAPGGDPRGHR